MRDVTLYLQAAAIVRVLLKVMAIAMCATGRFELGVTLFIGSDLLNDMTCWYAEGCVEVDQ